MTPLREPGRSSQWERALERSAPFNVTDPEEVVCNLLNPGVLIRSYPSKVVARWKRYVGPENFRVYFFDDLKESPAELRRSILCFLRRRSQQAKRRIEAARE